MTDQPGVGSEVQASVPSVAEADIAAVVETPVEEAREDFEQGLPAATTEAAPADDSLESMVPASTEAEATPAAPVTELADALVPPELTGEQILERLNRQDDEIAGIKADLEAIRAAEAQTAPPAETVPEPPATDIITSVPGVTGIVRRSDRPAPGQAPGFISEVPEEHKVYPNSDLHVVPTVITKEDIPGPLPEPAPAPESQPIITSADIPSAAPAEVGDASAGLRVQADEIAPQAPETPETPPTAPAEA